MFNRPRGRGRHYYNNNAQRSTQPPAPPRVERVVQETFEHCDTICIILNLDFESEEWFGQFKRAWARLKECQVVKDMLLQFYDICQNPYEQALRIMYNCVDFKHSKPNTLAAYTMNVFKFWKHSRNKDINDYVTQPLKITAFNIVRQQNYFGLMKLVAETYELALEGDVFLGIINSMLAEKQYKEACQCCALLGLHNKFSIHKFVVPLIIQDKINNVETFLKDSKEQQVELVCYLDKVIGEPSLKTFLEDYAIENDIADVKWDKLTMKCFKKLIARFAKTFKIAEEFTPNMNKKRNEGALQFLLYKKYNTDWNIGLESWKEMVHEAVKEDENLHRELVVQVSSFGDVEQALWFAENYQVPMEYWPFSVRCLKENPSDISYAYPEPIPQKTTVYHKLALAPTSIYLVDSESSFSRFLSVGLKDVSVIGFDCEWKPSFGGGNNELALMQIATRSEVYILDVMAIGGLQDLWIECNQKLFSNCDILKLGFSFEGDFSVIRKALPYIQMNKECGYLDLQRVWKLFDKVKGVFPYDVNGDGNGLSNLVHKCMGAELDKSDQFSNWEKRPLRESQLLYAALDAFCLIEIFDVLKAATEQTGAVFDDLIFQAMNKSSKERKQRRKTGQKNKPRAVKSIKTPIAPLDRSIPNIKFVCDTMLQGLGKSLRRCGLDTVILNNNEEHMECVRWHQNEKRCILTRGQIYNMLSGYVVQGECLCINSDIVEEQLQEVLSFYKLKVDKADVFSVCIYCNSKAFLKLDAATLKLLRDRSCSGLDTPSVATETCSDQKEYSMRELRHSNTYNVSEIDVHQVVTRNGVPILIDAVPSAVFEKVNDFYICELCGKVYWDGSHLERALLGPLQKVVLD